MAGPGPLSIHEARHGVTGGASALLLVLPSRIECTCQCFRPLFFEAVCPGEKLSRSFSNIHNIYVVILLGISELAIKTRKWNPRNRDFITKHSSIKKLTEADERDDVEASDIDNDLTSNISG
ncbi:hypothetical protein KQX54_018055 [Cotesia glomerata]|uniref:Uncharacterized protein n=1 Tax=Cotesia glomerata TaxID=32391 RepID=A0AAV7INZ4_COTGL|nr:hypothetical protein KQX54_018055 [Cotesia glomerata]